MHGDATQIAIGDFQSNYLPAPYLPLSWDVDGSWSYDPRTLTVLNVDRRRNNQAVAGLSYSVDSLLAQPDADELANATADSIDDTGLDDDVPSEIIDLAHQITDGAQGDGAKALALQNWLNDPARFTYDLNAPEGTGYEVLVNFLFNDRRGYCIHFASSMALMAKAVGIPARVAVGFTAGTQQADGSWLVTSHNMHAWPELYFAGLGWVGFEPTVSLGSQQPPQTEPAPQTPEAEPTPQAPENPEDTPAPDVPAPLPSPIAGISIDPRVLAGILAGLVALASPALARMGIRRKRLASSDAGDRVAGAWRELQATAVDLGMPWPAATPRQVAAMAWPGLDAEGRAALRRIALLVERRRYAAAPPPVAEVATDVGLISAQWYSSVSKGRRLAARMLPRSLFLGRKRRV